MAAGQELITKPEHYQYKVFSDPVHGQISIHPLCVKIIDTPEFQRLRFIKQRTSVYFVYPGASHNVFEHSLGVCYLADRLLRKLQKQQPDLNIEEQDILCVQIAGLCQDLGHGPFTHLFEQKFIPIVCHKTWTHKEASAKMFDRLVKENELEKDFDDNGIYDNDRAFIKELIHTKDNKDLLLTKSGRDKEKIYLFEIVSNTRNGIDVETWDSMARDCFMLGIRSNFDHRRCMTNVRIIKDEKGTGQLTLCFRDKEKRNLDEMFFLRAKLQERAYEHKKSFIVGEMIVEALVKVNDHFILEIEGEKEGEETTRRCKMSEAIDDMEALTQMTDDIFHRILCSPKQELKESRQILRNVLSRKLYKFVAEKQPGTMLKEAFKKQIPSEIAQKLPSFVEDDVVVQCLRLDFGPTLNIIGENVYFYSKAEPNKVIRMKQRTELPKSVKEDIVRIFLKKEAAQSNVEKALDSIFNKNPDQMEESVTSAERMDEGDCAEIYDRTIKKRRLDSGDEETDI